MKLLRRLQAPDDFSPSWKTPEVAVQAGWPTRTTLEWQNLTLNRANSTPEVQLFMG